LEIVESSKLISLKLWHGVPLLAQASLCVKPSGATFALNSGFALRQSQFLRCISLRTFGKNFQKDVRKGVEDRCHEVTLFL
jgi:hypothetical protein